MLSHTGELSAVKIVSGQMQQINQEITMFYLLEFRKIKFNTSPKL